MGKIEVLTQWSAEAALHSALEDVSAKDKVLVLIEYAEGGSGFRSANCTQADALYLMEKKKFDMFFSQEDGQGD